MNFLRSIFKKIDHSFSIKRLRNSFHGEQTGEAEDEIKKLWRESLKSFDNIKEAHLVLTKFRSNDVPHPALCLLPSCKDKKAIALKQEFRL